MSISGDMMPQVAGAHILTWGNHLGPPFPGSLNALRHRQVCRGICTTRAEGLYKWLNQRHFRLIKTNLHSVVPWLSLRNAHMVFPGNPHVSLSDGTMSWNNNSNSKIEWSLAALVHVSVSSGETLKPPQKNFKFNKCVIRRRLNLNIPFTDSFLWWVALVPGWNPVGCY